MKLRVAKKILKNQGNLSYVQNQVKKATVVTERMNRRASKKANQA